MALELKNLPDNAGVERDIEEIDDDTLRVKGLLF